MISTILPILVLALFWFAFWKLTSFLRPKRRAEADAPAVIAAARPHLPITSPLVLGPEAHENGAPEAQPFGEDIDSPDSRTIPAAFQGSWIYERADPATDKRRTILADDHVEAGVGVEPVVAVRVISPEEIAIVTQQIDNGKWLYALRYYGLLEGGAKLTDLENMDMRWIRT